MKLSNRIWQELGTLAAIVELIDHDSGTVRFKESATQADMDAVSAVIAAHDPLAKLPETLKREAYEAAKAEAKADAIVQYLRDHTPAECEQYVQNNVTDLASAKAFLKKVAAILSVLSKESLR